MYDYSPLRLSTSLEGAKRVFNPQSGDPSLFRYNQILLRPSEAYFQVTNFDVDYGFEAPFIMRVIDCAGRRLADVTLQTDFNVFTDSNGITQLAYEVGFLDLEFYSKTVFLTIQCDAIEFFSAPFNLSDQYNHEYVRLEYGYYGMSFETGIDFSIEELSGKAQTIGIRAKYSDIEMNRVDKGYTQMSTGLEVTGKALDTPFFKFLVEYSKPYDLLWLSRVLSADWINIGWGETLPTVYRVSNKPAQKSGEVIASSNLKTNEFSACLDLSGSRAWIPQMLPAFVVTERAPVADINTTEEYYTLVNFNDGAQYLGALIFNRDIGVLPTSFKVNIFKDGVFMESLLLTDDPANRVYYSGDQLSILLLNTGGTELITENGTYDIVVPPVYDQFGTQWNGYAAGEWRVIIADGEFDSDDFEPAEFLTDAI